MTTVTKYCLSFKLAPAALKNNILEGSANNVVICPAAVGIKRCDRENGIIMRAGSEVNICVTYVFGILKNLLHSFFFPQSLSSFPSERLVFLKRHKFGRFAASDGPVSQDFCSDTITSSAD